MTEKNTENGKYQVRDLPALRAKINRNFLIRLQPRSEKSRLVGFTSFCMIVGDLRAEHLATKAMNYKGDVPRFKIGAGVLQVVFYPR